MALAQDLKGTNEGRSSPIKPLMIAGRSAGG
jgi:hypothetical protein